MLTLSLSALANCWTKSRRAILTASGSTSTAAISNLAGDTPRDDTLIGLPALSGDPVLGIGLPLPSVVVA